MSVSVAFRLNMNDPILVILIRSRFLERESSSDYGPRNCDGKLDTVACPLSPVRNAF